MITHDQLDRLIAGQLTPSEFDELSHTCGPETIRRILDGDAKLRESIVSASAQPPTTNLMDRIDLTLEREASIPAWVAFLSRWGVLLGVVILAIAVVSLLPVLIESGVGGTGTMSPLLMTVGAILLAVLGVALYLEYGDRR